MQYFADPCNFLQILSASPVLTAIVRPRALCRARRPIIHQIEAKTNHHTTYFRGVTMEIVGIITYPVDMEAAATTKAAAATIAAAAVTARWFGTLARCGQPRHVDGHSDLAPLLEIPCNPCTSRLPVKPVHLKKVSDSTEEPVPVAHGLVPKSSETGRSSTWPRRVSPPLERPFEGFLYQGGTPPRGRTGNQ